MFERISLGDHHFSLHLHCHLVHRVDALDLLKNLSLLGGVQPLGVVVDLGDHLHVAALIWVLLLEVLHLLFTRHHLALVGDILILMLLELLQKMILGLLVASLHEAFLITRALHTVKHLVLVHSSQV